ncbi:uncharacterized protein BJ212DRAFT_1353971 [Suillus subaureus]|uniref:Uncharacterized protein n=1 Tax=Suillus subaureus TaxID=48587 RepID=A0A9P7ECK6_9AGAM|nr:uncharacterized protein BJ212DRAFT_1353971 [Suillus subaureus]KAG1816885.1 hypothetical protein BJ212DRAFT_1353971 [Suillus subaureus]
MSTDTWNNRSICFSLDPNHALRNPAELMEGASYHDDISPSFSLGADGWMVGPDHQLLFWVPPTSRHSFNTPWTTLVMDSRPTEVDLSRMAHGQHWQKCRDELCDR